MTLDRLEQIKRLVLNIIKTLHIKCFPINLDEILEFYGIQVHTYSSCNRELCLKYSEDSFSFGSKIFYDETMYPKRIRFSIAHELGHIMLIHTRLPENRLVEEEEADRFAACLLVPLIVVAKSNVVTIESIMDEFDISRYAASIAYRDYVTGCFSFHSMTPCDKELFDYISDDTDDTSNNVSLQNNSHFDTFNSRCHHSIDDMLFHVAEHDWLYGDDY